MTTSQDQANRLLMLVPYLRAHPGARVEDVARTFNVSATRLLKDLEVLWMCGLPGGLPGDLIDIDMDAAYDDGIINLTNADFLARPLRFTIDEVMSLIVALQAVREVATGPTAQAADSALQKLRGLAGGRDVDRVAIRVASGSDDVRAALLSALDRGRRVRLTYDGQTRGETTIPVVDPARIQLEDGCAYLQAWSLAHQEWRTYRVDRIAAVEELPELGAAHGPVPQLQGWFEDLDTAKQVTLDLLPEAVWITEYYPHRGLQRHDDGSVRAVFAVADPAWLTRLLLQLGVSARVVAPIGAGDEAVRQAREALQLADEWLAD